MKKKYGLRSLTSPEIKKVVEKLEKYKPTDKTDSWITILAGIIASALVGNFEIDTLIGATALPATVEGFKKIIELADTHLKSDTQNLRGSKGKAPTASGIAESAEEDDTPNLRGSSIFLEKRFIKNPTASGIAGKAVPPDGESAKEARSTVSEIAGDIPFIAPTASGIVPIGNNLVAGHELEIPDDKPDMKYSIHKQAVKRIFGSKGIDFTKASLQFVGEHGVPSGNVSDIMEDSRDILDQYRDVLRIQKLKFGSKNPQKVKQENIELNVLAMYADKSTTVGGIANTPQNVGVLLDAGALGLDMSKLQQLLSGQMPVMNPPVVEPPVKPPRKPTSGRIHEDKGKLFNKPESRFIIDKPVKNTLRKKVPHKYETKKGHIRF